MAEMIRISNAQAFWGDCPYAPVRLLRQQPDLDYLTLDYLAEVSMSIMAIQREKDPHAGYAKDFLEVIKGLIPLWKNCSKVKVVCNAGGLDPRACAKACAAMLRETGCNKIVGIVFGDDVLGLIRDDREIRNLETGETVMEVRDLLVTANAYLGAKPIADALNQGAEIVITGRVADPSLTVGPCLAHFGWDLADYDKIAQATVAGHLIECGTQATGGISSQWMEIKDPARLGYPVVEMSRDATFVITKPLGTSGIVNMQTVKEQLLYEIGDPAHYLSPDVTVSFTTLKLENDGPDRIRVVGAKGEPPPSTYKVSATYRDGYRADGILGVVGYQAVKKARACGEMLIEKVKEAGYVLEKTHVECLGSGDAVPGVLAIDSANMLECILRVCVADKRREAVECFSKQLASLVTGGPQGVCGYTAGRPRIRSVFGYWPCLIDVDRVSAKIDVIGVDASDKQLEFITRHP